MCVCNMKEIPTWVSEISSKDKMWPAIQGEARTPASVVVGSQGEILTHPCLLLLEHHSEEGYG